uniref:Uncharacterized protein n=1 Tax=Lotus japonicus TaxID=34305 RepID=I3SQM9_LOTJA|nr:unknown [Lotus japonicus]
MHSPVPRIITQIKKLCKKPSSSLVKFEVSIGLLHVCPITLLKVLWQYDISILTNSVHSCFLANSLYLSSTDFVRSRNIILKVYFITQVHFGSANLLKNKSSKIGWKVAENK